MSCRGRGGCGCVSEDEPTTEREIQVGDRVRARSWVSGVSGVGTVEFVDNGESYPYIVSGLPEGLEDIFRRDELTLLEPEGSQIRVEILGDASALESAFAQVSPEETTLQEAQRLVYGDRNVSYGHPADDYGRTAKLWSAILDVEVTPAQAALCMVAVKISRECHAPQRDNRVDGAGYFAVVDRIRRREEGLE